MQKELIRIPEFAKIHGITWSAVDYLIRMNIIDHTRYKGRKYVKMTPKTKKYVPNTKHGEITR